MQKILSAKRVTRRKAQKSTGSVEKFDGQSSVLYGRERDKEIQEWIEQKLPKVLPGYSGGCQEEAQKKKTEKEWRKRREKEKSGMKSIKKWFEDANSTAKRTVGQSVKQKKRTGKRRTRRKCNGPRMREWRRFWNEGEWEEVPCSWKLCKRYLDWWHMNECFKVKKSEVQEKRRKFKGWSTEEMKHKLSSSMEEDSREMNEWRSMCQEEMDQCCVSGRDGSMLENVDGEN